MEVSGIEGTFKITCQHTMRVLRENKESILAVLEAFVHDPLINWRLVQGGRQVGGQQARGGAENGAAGATRRPRGDETNIHDGASLSLNSLALSLSLSPLLHLPRRSQDDDAHALTRFFRPQMERWARSTLGLCKSSSACNRSSPAATSSRRRASRSMHKSTGSSSRRRRCPTSRRCSSAGPSSSQGVLPRCPLVVPGARCPFRPQC